MKKVMLRVLPLMSVLCMSASFVYAQSQNLKDYPFLLEDGDGYIITSSGDSIGGGKLYLGSLPSHITFKPMYEPGKSDKYYPKDVQKALVHGHLFKPLKYKVKGAISVGDGTPLLEIIEEGNKLSYCRRYSIAHELTPGQQSTKLEVEDLLIKPDGSAVSLTDIRFINFSKGMSKLLMDNPTLSQKVLNKEKGYLKTDLAAIVKEYNQ